MRFVVILSAVLALMPLAYGHSTDYPCDIRCSQDLPKYKICNITQPYTEVCFSNVCTYSVLPEFLDHSKDHDCETTWYTPDTRSLADPLYPEKLSDPAINVTLESLSTKHHVDGLYISIVCHKTNEKNMGVYRVCNPSASPPGAQPSGLLETQGGNTSSSVVLAAVGAVTTTLLLTSVGVLIYYYRK